MTERDLHIIAAQAWNIIKPDSDPPFSQCAPHHQSCLAYKVASVVSTGRLEDAFDAAVYAILNPPPPVASEPQPPPPEVASEPQPAPPAKKTRKRRKAV